MQSSDRLDWVKVTPVREIDAMVGLMGLCS